MKQINILIVEDEETHIDSWKTSISQFNRIVDRDGGKFCLYHKFARNHEEAKQKLNTFLFDIAVVDIRLSQNEFGYNDTSGNKVIKDILNNSICLVAAYTGQSIDVELSEAEKKFIKVVDRSNMTKRDLLNNLVEQDALLDAIINVKSTFRKSKASRFYSSIWPRWDLWLSGEQDQVDIKDALMRHMATHLHASFLNETIHVHPEEHYFIPSLTKKLDTGDITKVDGKHYINVTPRCEIAQEKNRTYQFVALKDISLELNGFEDDILDAETKIVDLQAKLSVAKKDVIAAKTNKKTTEKNILQAKKDLKTQLRKKTQTDGSHETVNELIVGLAENIIRLEQEDSNTAKELTQADLTVSKFDKELQQLRNRQAKAKVNKSRLFKHGGNKASLHFLPEIKQPDKNSYGPFHAQFDQIVHVDNTDNTELSAYKDGKYASLSNEFVPSLVERLGSHFSRIGTPDYSHPE